ncbi:MAG TPA: hypothetical protein VGZ32_27205 [Actinocrinis sp.]|jgi:hypothetical protein|uniref:hypothetical protein n=1 Tax=Actinocrinis sp. TaxID=1920516 RepID=UPI002DDD3CB8|nr:hypothetical protein [Actinocrinis sp.]HEV3174066.1 hypothetical protein [Actinocrinis sp.]
MADLYRDRWITCTEDGIEIRWYYLWGHKEIPYSAIRSARRVRLSALRGKGRIWGTANLRYWASLDPGRPGKQIGIVLGVGSRVSPFITPDDPSAVAEIIRERSGLKEIPLEEAGPIV